MTTKTPLDTLIELTRERTDEAARRLGELLRAQAGAAERLRVLQQYRDEYLQQFQARMCEGLSTTQLRNFQRFVDTLDGAIVQQQRIATQADAHLAQGRSDWQASQRRLGAFDTLAQRALRQQALAQGRREQREGDERASLRFHARNSALAG